MDVAEGQVAVDGHVKQGDLDNSHDHQQLGNESGQGRHTGQGHHEDEHGNGEERVALGQTAEGFQRVTALLRLEQRKHEERTELETDEHREVEDEGRDNHERCIVAHVDVAVLPVERSDCRDGGQHVAGVSDR